MKYSFRYKVVAPNHPLYTNIRIGAFSIALIPCYIYFTILSPHYNN